MPTTFLWFLFDWRGRISRSAYRIAILALAVFIALIYVVPTRVPALLAGLAALQLIVSMALDAKRMHDIGASALLVTATSVGGVALIAAFAHYSPEAMATVSAQIEEKFGPLVGGHSAVCIAVSGLGLGSIVRWPFLSMMQSRDSGDAYAYAPAARVSDPALAPGKAEAKIAAALEQALIDRQLQDAAAALAKIANSAQPAAKTAAAAGRKTFGRRVA